MNLAIVLNQKKYMFLVFLLDNDNIWLLVLFFSRSQSTFVIPILQNGKLRQKGCDLSKVTDLTSGRAEN